MSYGLRMYAKDASMVLSDLTYQPIYIGDATLISAVNNSGTFGNGNSPRLTRVNTYRIQSPTRPVVFVSAFGGYFHLAGINPSGGNNWDITIFFDSAPNPRILCFSKMTEPSNDAYGMRIYRPDGSVAFDSGLKHLLIDRVVTVPTMSCSRSSGKSGQIYYTVFPIGGSSASFEALNSPAICASSEAVALCGEQIQNYTYALGFAMQGFYISNTSVSAAWCSIYATSGSPTIPEGYHGNGPKVVALINASRYI